MSNVLLRHANIFVYFSCKYNHIHMLITNFYFSKLTLIMLFAVFKRCNNTMSTYHKKIINE
ncbi:MAG: S-adenosylmethionine:tRNA ribosyltransferase-isomerase [Buchnera aphidicola (Microlophium carnosum)]|uniref:S-adenosylmethionine:tRNA ribosyltransferase-isomerase n=1 Tax=Buchnera aphidicola (Microlophium carnosum) TaxID=2708354 RepID=A0A6G9JTV5_9GAMM|nr:MAG: S-adenosylmethionine:tRNA ribosyltransferase-isomerase [Buchnera aphidicola (Microlophium carnosum)]